MINQVKKIKVLLFILISLFICSMGLFAFSNINPAKADDVDIEISLDGAQVKFINEAESSEATIRFVASVNKSDLDELLAVDSSAKVIMRIVPKSLLEDEDIDALEVDTKYSKIKDIDVTNSRFIEKRGGVDYYTFKIYATGTLNNYRYLDLSCIAYIKTNGVVVANSVEKTRSIGQVAALALTDTKAEADDVYKYETATGYSPYEPDLRDILNNTVESNDVSLPSSDYFDITTSNTTAYRGLPYSVTINNTEGYKVYSVKIGGVEATNDNGTWTIPAVSANGVDVEIEYSLDIEYTDSDKSFNFYAYYGPSDGSYTENGEPLTSEEDFRTVARYAEYKESGLNVLFLTGSSAYDYTRFSWENSTTKKQVDLAHAAGIDKVIITDMKLFGISKGAGLYGEGKKFASEAALIEYVKARLSDYIGYRGVYGVALADEPTYGNLDSYAQMYKAIKTAAAQLGYPDFYVQVNLLPYTIINSNFYDAWVDAGYISDYGTNINPYWSCVGTNTSEQLFEVYVRKFLDLSGADHLQIDGYPLLDGEKAVFNYIRGLELAAKICKIYDADLEVVTQSNSWMSPVNTSRELTEDDARWLNNLLLGFGAKTISYFTYSRPATNNNEGDYYEWNNDGTAFISQDGSKTALYYYMQKIMAENQDFASTILNFEYNKCTWKKGTNFSDQYLDSVSQNTMTKITTLGSVTNRTALLITELVDSEKGNYMYMLQNVLDPAYYSYGLTTTITFSSEYNYALVFVNGKTYYTELNSHKYTAEAILPGYAVFVMPFSVSGITIESQEIEEYSPMEVPEISYTKYSADEYIEYNVGDTVTFNDLYTTIAFTTDATKVMKSVTYNKVTTSLIGKTGYKFTKTGLYTFKFAGVNDSGYEMEGMVTVRVKNISSGAQTWLTNNGVTLEGALSMDNNQKVVLSAGTYSGTYDYVPYVAYNGEYGIGDYVMFDFTGKNMPQVALFADTVTSSLRDSYTGIYISNGMTESDGATNCDSNAGRLTIFGPLKIPASVTDYTNKSNTKEILAQDGSYISWYDISDTNYPVKISYLALEDDVHYRYIVGFESGSVGAMTSTGVVDIYLYNADTGDLIYSNKLSIEADFIGSEDDQFKGNIVAYGRYGESITIDRIYPIQSDIESIMSEFKATAPYRAVVGDSFEISDFVEYDSGDELFLIAPNGNKTEVTGDITFTTAGEYVLIFKDGDKAVTKNTVQVYGTPWYKVIYNLGVYSEYEWIYNGGNVGDSTSAVAKEFYGFIPETITQQTIKADCSTEVTVNYTSNDLITTFDNETVEEYTIAASTAFGDYKVAKDGEDDTIYSGVFLNSVEIADEGYERKALKVTNMDLTDVAGYSTAKGYATIRIKLTDEQKTAFNEGGKIKFRYRVLLTKVDSNGYSSFTLKVNSETIKNIAVYTSSASSQWQECVLEKRGDAFATEQEYLIINLSAAAIYSGHLWTMWIDDIEVVEDDRAFYTVNHYLADENGEYTILNKTEKIKVEETGVDTDATALTINGFTAKSFENAEILADNSTVINIYYDCDNELINGFEREATQTYTVTKSSNFTTYLPIGESGHSSVYLNTAEIVEGEGIDGSKALKITNDNSAGGVGRIRIALTNTQKSVLAAGGTITIRYKYKLNASSGYSRFNVEIDGENDVVRAFSSTVSDWREYTVSKNGTQLTDYLDYIQIKISLNTNYSGTSWTMWFDDIEVVEDTRPSYTVNRYRVDNNGKYTVLINSETLKVDALGDDSDIDFTDIVVTDGALKYTYSAINDSQVAITSDGQIVNVYYATEIVDSFETLTTAGIADKVRFGKIAGGNIINYAQTAFGVAEISATAKTGSQSVRYFIYNSETVTLKATMSATQLALISDFDTVSLAFEWKKYSSGTSTVVSKVTAYIGNESGSMIGEYTVDELTWTTITLTGADKIQEFIAAGGIIALKADITGYKYAYVFIDDFTVQKNAVETATLFDFESDDTEYDAYTENASFSGTSYLTKAGAPTAYSGAYLKELGIATDNAHSGDQAIKYKNDYVANGWGKLQIDLTSEQQALITEGAVITFWCKFEAVTSATNIKSSFDFKVNGVVQDCLWGVSSDVAGADEYTAWRKVSVVVDATMLTNYSDKIVVLTSNATQASGFGYVRTYYMWIDDITVSYVAD